MRKSLVSLNLIFLAMSLFISACSTSRPLQGRERDVQFSARSGDEVRKRVLVLPFLDASTSRSNLVAQEARKAFIRALATTDRFVFVAPSDLSKDPSNYVKNGQYDMENLVRGLEGLSVAAVIEGKVLDVKAIRLGDDVGLFRRFKARVEGSLHVRVVSVQNAKELYSGVNKATIEAQTTRFADTSVNGQNLQEDVKLTTQALTKASHQAISPILAAISKLSWEGRIATIQGNRIFLNAGRLSGLQVGDILKVTDRGEEIYDPETGEFIGVAPGRMKGTLELVSYFGQDGAITVIHSGSGFRENDIVELY